MRLLDRYLLRELLVPLGYCMGGFLIFYISFDLIFSINRFQEHHLLAKDVLEYYLATLPESLVVIIPIALLLALLYALTNHSRYNELTAIRAAGVSLWRLSMGYVGVGIVLGLTMLAINELWAPQASEKGDEIMQRRQGQAKNRLWHPNLKFRNEASGRSWDVLNFNIATSEMIQPSVIWQMRDGTRKAIYAQRGLYTNDEWTFYGVEEWDTAPHAFPMQQTNEVARFNFAENPEWIRSEIKIVTMTPAQAAKRPQLSIVEILDYMRLHPQLNAEKQASLMTQLQGRFAAPFTCLAVVLIALPFGALSGRRNVFVGVAASIFICFAYFIVQRISFGMGIGHMLPPVLAAWLPNMLFGVTGLVLIARVR